MVEVPFNLNHYARVKFTQVGLDAWREQAGNWRMRFPGSDQTWPLEPPLDAEGYWREQAWEIIRFIGPMLGNGIPSPISTEILLELPNTPRRAEDEGVGDA